MPEPYSPLARSSIEIGVMIGRLPTEIRSFSEISDGEIPDSFATKSTTNLPQIRPWHIPIPHRESNFAVRESVAPSSITENFNFEYFTSSQRQIIVSSVSQPCHPDLTG
jgi:hypothetical protein